jgi:diaminohydroxyphosphoribosylaminopyrimidine deaminase/5-amino-6-(5-phosphoribosylamino)uracil reductase
VRDEVAMEQALDAGAAVRRRTAPNPWIGCVIVRDGDVVGVGATEPPGGAHAEIGALREAADRARGATAYVTLEPCCFHGRTPPCADALIGAGILRVVVALEDPDPRVGGRGIAQLRDAGIEVTVGVGAERATRDLAPYLHHRRSGRAFVVAKVASSFDGRAAAADGSSQWLTSADARADAHELRADSQAIVVGSGTALADQPRLTVRDAEPPPRHPPTRVLLDARGRVPAIGPLLDTELAPTLVVTTAAAPASSVDAWRAVGAKVESVAAAPGGGVDLAETFALLGREGVLQVLVEGGARVLGAVTSAGLAQRVVVYVAPLALGTRGTPAFVFPGPESLDAASRYDLTAVRRLGPDVRLDYEPSGAI